MQTEFSLQTAFQRLSIHHQRIPTKATLPQEDVTKLVQLGVTDETGKVFQEIPLLLAITDDLQTNINAFLDIKRDGNTSLRSTLKTILSLLKGQCFAPVAMGEDLKSILGWQFLSNLFMQLIHSKDPSLQLSDCLSYEYQHIVKAECQKIPEALTIRFQLFPHVDRQSVVNSIHQQLGEGFSQPLHIDDDKTNTHFSTFGQNSQVFDVSQRIHFTFVTSAAPNAMSTDALQIGLADDFLHRTVPPLVLACNQSNQWCVDTMLKTTRIAFTSKKMAKLLFNYIRNGFELQNDSLAILKHELFEYPSALLDFWNRSTGDKAQNALFLCQLCKKLDANDAIAPFLNKIHLTEDQSIWNIAVRLLASNQVSYDELMSILQVMFIGASVCCDKVTTTESFVYFSGFKVELQLSKALDIFPALYARLNTIHQLVEALYNLPLCKKETPALAKLLQEIPLTSHSPKPYLQTLILSLLPANGHFLESALSNYLDNVRIASIQERHSYKILLKALSVIHDFEFPQIEQDSAWAECLLQSKNPRCVAVGTRMLLALKGHAACKLRWMPYLQDNAFTIIRQIHNDEAVTENDVTQWLKLPCKDLVWDFLVTTNSQRWLRVCVVAYPERIAATTLHENTLRGIIKALKTKDRLQDDFTAAVLPIACSSWALQNASDAIRPILERLTAKNKAFIESTLKEFVNSALATNNQALAITFMKTYLRLQCHDFDDVDKRQLLTCIKNSQDKEAALWFMDIVNSVVGCTFMQDRQVDLYLHLAAMHSGFAHQHHHKYLQSLYNTLEDSQKADLKQKITAFISSHPKLKDVLEKIFINFLRWKPLQAPEIAVTSNRPKTGICELEPLTPRSTALATLHNQDTDTAILSKNDKSHLRNIHEAFIANAIANENWDVALSFMKVCIRHNVAIIRPEHVVECMRENLPEDLIRWYLSLRGNFIAYKVNPLGQLRIFLQIAKNYLHLVSEEDAPYIAELKKRIITPIPADLQAAIQAANITLFAPFLVQKKEKVAVVTAKKPSLVETIGSLIKEDKATLAADKLLNCPVSAEYQALIRPCIRSLLDCTPIDPKDQIFPLLIKFCSTSSHEWLMTFNALQSNLESQMIAKQCLARLLACRDMPEHVSRTLWLTIFKNGQWLQYTEALCVLEHLDFFKQLLWNTDKSINMLADVLAFFVVVLEKPDQNIQKYLPLLHDWYSLVPLSHNARLEVGLRLLGFCTPADNPASIKRSCDVVISFNDQLENALTAKKPRSLEPVLANLRKFIASVRSDQTISEKAVCGLLRSFGKLKAPAAHEFAVLECSVNSSLAVKEALWPSCKHQLITSTKVEVQQRAASVAQALLESTDAEILLEVFARQFKADNTDFLMNDKSTTSITYPEYTKHYERLLKLCIESPDPAHCKNALAIDIVISNHYPNQTKDIINAVDDYVLLRLKLLLKQIQYHGFTPETKSRFTAIFLNFTKEQVFTHLATSKEHPIDLKLCYKYANHPRFYTYSQKVHDNQAVSEKEEVGSLYPECTDVPAVKDEMTCLYTMLYTAFGYAATARHMPEQRNRLLDFIVQTLRNLVEYHTHVVFNYDCISILSKELTSDDPLFETHADIVADLVRATIKKGIVSNTCQNVVEILTYVQKQPATENPKLLREIVKALYDVTKHNVVEVLITQQKKLLMWQERFFDGDYQGRQLVIDALFAVWRKFPFVVSHLSVLRSMSDIQMPTSVRFGSNDGPKGKKAASDALVSYFTCYIDIYKEIVRKNKNFYMPILTKSKIPCKTVSPEGEAAQKYLETIVNEFENSRFAGAYAEDYDTFLDLARRIMGLFRSPCYVDFQVISDIHETFAETLLAKITHAQDRRKQALLVNEWIEVIRGHNSGSLQRDMLGRIRKSGIWMFFTTDHLEDFVDLLDEAGRFDLYKTINQLQLSANTLSTEIMNQLYIIARSYKTSDKAPKTPTAERCVGAMMFFLQKHESSIEYTQFIKYAMQIGIPLLGPSYIDIASMRKYITAFITQILKKPCPEGSEPLRGLFVYEWLLVVESQKSGSKTLFAALLNEAMEKFIEANCFSAFNALGDKENATLDSCYKQWLETSIPNEKLIALYQRQTAFKRIPEAFANLEAEVTKVIEQLEL